MTISNIILTKKNSIGVVLYTIEIFPTFVETNMVHDFIKIPTPSFNPTDTPSVILIDLKNIIQTLTIKGYVHEDTNPDTGVVTTSAQTKKTNFISMVNIGGSIICDYSDSDDPIKWVIQNWKLREENTSESEGDSSKYYIEINIMKITSVMKGD